MKLRVDRDDDFLITGRRHCFHYEYEVGFDDEGRVLGAELTMVSRAGFSADLSGPVMTRAVCHFDNAYWLPDVAVHGYSGRTNTQSNTAFRGFGGPQGAIAIENIVDSIARRLGKDALDVRRVNFYGPSPLPGAANKGQRNVTPYGQLVEDNIIHELAAELETMSGYRAKRREIDTFNATSTVLKRGLALTPVKFGISFNLVHLNQAGALVHVYGDGSVLVNHGGTEMGQGLNTKVAQVVAHELGIAFDAVRVTATDTQKIANTSATAASTGSDLNGKAAQDAARQIKARLIEFACRHFGVDAPEICFANGSVEIGAPGVAGSRTMSFRELIVMAYMARVQLWSDGFYATPGLSWDKDTMQGRPFFYFRLRRGRERGRRRLAHRRVAATCRPRAARRRPLAEPGHRHRPDRGRLHPGHGLADDGRARLASERRLGQGRPAPHARAQHLQDPDRQRLPARLRRAAMEGRQPRRRQRLRHDPPQQGDRRAAAAAAVLGVLRDPRCGVGGGRPPRRSEAGGTGDERIDPAGDHGRAGSCGASDVIASVLRDVAAAWVAGGRRAVVIEVVDTRGSAPRDAGARMLVAGDDVVGTIGGGHLELKAIVAAQAMLAEGEVLDRELRFALGPSLGQCCGGVVSVTLSLLDAAAMMRWRVEAPLFYLQLHGAGHVGRAITTLLATLDCRVDWFDERDEEFPSATNLGSPWPVHIRQISGDTIEREVQRAPAGAFYLVLTHEHALDQRIAEAILRRGDFAFFGLIGSATKRATFTRRFEERGIEPAAINRMACPIGVDGIEGKAPEVVAAGVVAQLLQEHSKASRAAPHDVDVVATPSLR